MRSSTGTAYEIIIMNIYTHKIENGIIQFCNQMTDQPRNKSNGQLNIEKYLLLRHIQYAIGCEMSKVSQWSIFI